MAFRRWIVIMITMFAGLSIRVGQSSAKPPDLPVEQRVRCPEEERPARDASESTAPDQREEAVAGRDGPCRQHHDRFRDQDSLDEHRVGRYIMNEAGDAEEQEAPSSDRQPLDNTHREMLRETQMLGTVPVELI